MCVCYVQHMYIYIYAQQMDMDLFRTWLSDAFLILRRDLSLSLSIYIYIYIYICTSVDGMGGQAGNKQLGTHMLLCTQEAIRFSIKF